MIEPISFLVGMTAGLLVGSIIARWTDDLGYGPRPKRKP